MQASGRAAPGLSEITAAGIEAGMTALLALTIFLFLSNVRSMHWTPLDPHDA